MWRILIWCLKIATLSLHKSRQIWNTYLLSLTKKILNSIIIMFCWPCIMIYLYNMNRQDTLFTFNLFKKLTSTYFKQAYCSSTGGIILYIQQLVYVMCLCWLAVDRILPTASQHKRMTYTNCCIYRVIPPDDEQ